MVPALPVPLVSVVILPCPRMSIKLGADRLIFPPFPDALVRAEIKPSLVKRIFKSGLLLSGLRVRVPAGACPWVSAKIPNFPEI